MVREVLATIIPLKYLTEIAYAALGYVIKNGLRVQLGIMNQTTDNQGKNQLQLSLHHKF